MREELAEKVSLAVSRLVSSGRLPDAAYPAVEITDTKSPEHGDFACNFALAASKLAGLQPRAIGDLLALELSGDPDFEKVEVAGPGFVNLTLSPVCAARVLGAVLGDPEGFYHGSPERPLKINVEYVSVNPNGPITIGSGRGAAYGSTLCKVLEAAGHTVHREYYINDGVNSEQMRLFGESVHARFLQLLGYDAPLPANGYAGEYVEALASETASDLAYGDTLMPFQGTWRPVQRLYQALLSLLIKRARIDKMGLREFVPTLTKSGQFTYAAIEASTYLQRQASKPIWEYEIAANVPRLEANLSGVAAPFKGGGRDQIIAGILQVAAWAIGAEFPQGDCNSVAARIRHRLEALLGDEGTRLSRQSELWPIPQAGTWDFVGLNLLFSTFSPYTFLDPDGPRRFAQASMIHRQREDLAAFGVEFDTWFSEQSLHDSGAVGAEIDHLVRTGAADDKEYRNKVKFGKGGAIEEVEVESQASEDDEGPDNADYDEIEKREMTSEGGLARVNETLWLRSTKFGDDMDRVLRRRDGRLTYIASDVAYHKDKFTRPPNADRLITVLGPDHHGYIGRLQAVVAATLMEPKGEPADTFDECDAKIWKDAKEKKACLDALAAAREKLTVQIFQLVRFMKDGKPSPMRKRDGNIYALIDLIDEIGEKVQPDGSADEKRRSGRDVARFFYLMRSHDTTFDFDLDLAEKQSEDNPVFYAQYAHARICGVIEKAKESDLPSPLSGRGAGGEGLKLTLLTHPKEKALIIKLQDLGYEVARCAEDYGVNRLTTYAVELARTYHHFYDACRVIQPEQPELSQARLALCVATRSSLRAAFDLLGISAPERM